MVSRSSYYLPWRFLKNRFSDHHFENSGFLQLILFTWIFPLVKRGLKKSLELKDLGNLTENLKSNVLLKRLNHYIEKEKGQSDSMSKVSLLKVYFLFSKETIFSSLFMNVIGISAEFVTVLMIRRFIRFLEYRTKELTEGLIIILVIFVTFSIRTVNRNLGHFINYKAGLHAKTAFIALIYQKAMKLKDCSSTSVGQLVNLCANDTGRIFEASIYLVNLICMPFLLLVYIVYLVYLFGPISLVGGGILMLNMPVQLFSGKIFSILRGKAAKISDQRIKMISEALTYVKFIKMYAWEEPFARMIYNFREKEKKCIRQMAFFEGFTFSFAYVIGFMAPLATIVTAVYVGKELTAAETLTLLAVFKILGFYSITGPNGMKSFAEMIVSFKRIKQLLIMDERNGISHFKINNSDNLMLNVTNSSFSWAKTKNNLKASEELREDIESESELKVKFLPKEEEGEKATEINSTQFHSFVLSNLNLEIKQGELIGICGSVGCGKSSFLQAVMGELEQLSGNLNITESLAYVPQQAWIFNATIRENILLGNDYDEKLYTTVCTRCSLDEDLNSFPSGDLTEIGERGINLSGGQKQRVSLARAIYSQKKLLLLDDPLSAVDSHVGKYIFRNCIKKCLKESSAVILITHQLQYLKDCDYIVHVENGQFIEQGTYEQIMNSNGKLATKLANDARSFHAEKSFQKKEGDRRNGVDIEEYDEQQTENQVVENEKYLQEKGRLIDKEDREKGVVTMATYFDFCKYIGGAFPVLLVLFVIFGSVAMDFYSQYWLSVWLDVKTPQQFSNSTNDVEPTTIDETKFMSIYCGAVVTAFLTAILSTILVVYFILRGSTKLHNSVFKIIFQSSMEFFDTTPIGRIINRLAKDVDEIDNQLPLLVENGVRLFASSLGNILFVALTIPYMLIPLLPLLFIMFILNQGFRKVTREIKRTEHVTRSFVYSHLTASIQGASSIKAYNKQQHFTGMFESYLNDNTLSLYNFFATTRWFSTYTDVCCLVISLATCITVLFLKESIPPSLAGLCVIFSLSLIGNVPFVYRALADTEAKFTSVERLNHYIKTVKPEGEFERKDQKRLLKSWPQTGNILFENVHLRYRESLPLVLKDMSVKINDKEKIGIVGRTGAGKSTITVALYRLVNPQNGVIKIDGIDTKNVGLTDLRNAMTVIPQDPVLFVGSIRYNLDPFNQYNDDALWNSLEKAHIKDLIGNFKLKLETEVHENGSNFSVGERQLLCMARALLRDKKILVLDEATAAIDSETDQKIQETIQTSFQDCTVLTIAHRLNTVMYCDKILVMEKGQVVEYDTPANLLSTESRFNEMTNKANILLTKSD